MVQWHRFCGSFIDPFATYESKLELAYIKIILAHFFMHGSELADDKPLTATAHFLPSRANVILLS